MKKILILGLGHVGQALALRLRAAGVRVAGTTTTPAKVERLSACADEVHVLRGTDTVEVVAASKGCDAIVVTVAPKVRESRTPDERAGTYRDTLVASCQSAAAANPRVVFLSSFSVYGAGSAGSGPITEDTPTGNEGEPSARYYAQAERMALSTARACVLRLPDIYGAPGDLSFAERVKLGHEVMGGRVPFSPDARLYIIHFQDVVSAVVHALERQLTGIYNVCVDSLPRTNREVFDELSRRQNLPPLQFLAQIKAPTCKISAAKIHASGWRPTHTDPDFPLR